MECSKLHIRCLTACQILIHVCWWGFEFFHARFLHLLAYGVASLNTSCSFPLMFLLECLANFSASIHSSSGSKLYSCFGWLLVNDVSVGFVHTNQYTLYWHYNTTKLTLTMMVDCLVHHMYRCRYLILFWNKNNERYVLYLCEYYDFISMLFLIVVLQYQPCAEELEDDYYK